MFYAVCSYHVTYAFQSESTLYSCLNVKQLLARSRSKIWSLNYRNWIRTHNHLVRKWTLNHLAKLAKWLNCVVSTCLYGAFNCMFLEFHIKLSKILLTACADELLYNVRLINLCSTCDKQNAVVKIASIFIVHCHLVWSSQTMPGSISY